MRPAFSFFQNSIDATCQAFKGLADYDDSKTKPWEVEGGDQKVTDTPCRGLETADS